METIVTNNLKRKYVTLEAKYEKTFVFNRDKNYIQVRILSVQLLIWFEELLGQLMITVIMDWLKASLTIFLV